MDFQSRLSQFRNAGKAGQQALDKSAMDSTRDAVQRKLKLDEEYRINVLRKVKTLAGLSDDELRHAAHTMVEESYEKGDFIITQEDRGDSFFVLESGVVRVERKSNMRDQNEEPMVIAKLGADSFFGEIALMTDEARSASVVCHSAVCKCLIMTKRKFDEVRQTSHKATATLRETIGRNVLNTVKIFNELRKDQKDYLLRSMKVVTYPPGAYITRQNAVGHNMFILTEGECKITLNVAGSTKEREVHTLVAGSYFGEMALLDPSSKRTANVVSVADVTVLTLNRSEFNSLIKKETQGSLDDHGGHRRAVAAGSAKDKGSIRPSRKVTGMTRGVKDDKAMGSIMPRMVRFLFESLTLSMYARLYRAFCIKGEAVDMAGDIACAIMEEGPSRDQAVMAIRKAAIIVLSKAPTQRSEVEHKFLQGLLQQRNKILDVMTRDWHQYQINELCKTAKYLTVAPRAHVLDIGDRSGSLFLILRGAVRVWSGKGRSSMRHECDLAPGEVFGEATIFANSRTSSICVQAMVEVDLCEFDAETYQSIAQSGQQRLTVEEREAFLRQQCPLLKGESAETISRLTMLLTQREIPKGKLVLQRKHEYPQLSFLVHGSMSVYHKPSKPTLLFSIEAGESFGESGFMNLFCPNLDNMGKPVTAVESFCAVASTRCTVLTLETLGANAFVPSQNRSLCDAVRAAYWARRQGRSLRLEAARTERKSMRRVEREVRVEGAMYASTAAVQQSAAAPGTAQAATTTSQDFAGSESGRGNRSPNRSPSPSPSRSPSPNPGPQFETGPEEGKSVIAPQTTNVNAMTGPGVAQQPQPRPKPMTPKNAQFIVAPAPGFVPPALTELLSDGDMEDIPCHMNIALDPFMCVAVAINDVQTERTRSRLAEIRKPRSARTKDGSAASRRDEGFSKLIGTELGLAPWERPATAPHDSQTGRITRAVGTAAELERQCRLESITNTTSALSRGCTSKSSSALMAAATHLTTATEALWRASISRPQSSGLSGTSRVPNV